MLNDVFVLDCVRTPRARVKDGGSALSGIHPQELLAQCMRALLRRTSVDPALVEDVIAGCVTEFGEQGGNIARNAVLAAGLPDSIGGVSLNRYCASGLQALNFAAMQVASGMSDLLIAGGVESMSRVPMLSDASELDGKNILLRKKLFQIPQGISADLLATLHDYGREDLDRFAVDSQRKAALAQQQGRFSSGIIAVKDPLTGQTIMEKDNYLRHETTLESLSTLKPAFAKLGATPVGDNACSLDDIALSHYRQLSAINHVHTAGTSSGIVDGAAAALICSGKFAREHSLKPRARITSAATGGSDPILMLSGPPDVSRKALKLAGMKPSAVELWEINEAFAAVPLFTAKELGIDMDRVNVNGGAIALGHPLGATGAMLLGQALDELERSGLSTAVVTLCAAGGQSIATVLERA